MEYCGQGQRLKQHKKTAWRDQVLNGDIAKELSPATLGARRGDQAYDHKTDTLYLIEDEDHPVKRGDSRGPAKASAK